MKCVSAETNRVYRGARGSFIIKMKPIGPTKITSASIENLPPLIVGGAVLNFIYTKDPTQLPIRDILQIAFLKGLVALDTSPYYGRSEELIGKALQELQTEWPRESYFICTKAGRIGPDTFDYSREHVRSSVLKSLKLLNTTYLDLVYMHDIEFVQDADVFEALKELRLLKDEGIIKNFGFSAYPVELLYDIGVRCVREYASDIGPVDAILSYSHGCLQNTKLFDWEPKLFLDCKIKKLMNGSILSMSLLRSGPTHDFHPGDAKLKARVQEVSQALQEKYGIELADLATRFALRRWLFETGPDGAKSTDWNKKTSVVIGTSTVQELMVAIDSFHKVKSGRNEKDEELYKWFIDQLGSHYNEVWPSGLH